MSEKRFTFGAVSPNVAMIKDNGEPMNIGEVVDKLNEQQSTILFLQDEIDELKKDIDIYEYEEKKHSKTARKLYEENEQLKEENKYLKKRIKVISDELYCKDRKLEELGVPIECCDKR